MKNEVIVDSQVVTPEVLSSETDVIIANAANTEFPVCSTSQVNLDIAYSQVYGRMVAEMQKAGVLNSWDCAYAAAGWPCVFNFYNYNGTIVYNNGQGFLAAEGDNLYQNLCFIPALGDLLRANPSLLPLYVERYIMPRILENKVLKFHSQVIQIIKAELLTQIIRQFKKDIFAADYRDRFYSTVQSALQRMDLVAYRQNYVAKTSVPLAAIKANLKSKEKLAYLFKSIYTITGGKIKGFDSLCKLMAEIMIGRESLKYDLTISPKLTVIKINNFTFFLQWMCSILDTDFVRQRNPRGKINVFNEIIQHHNDIMAYREGKLKYLPNLSPMRKTKVLTHYSTKELTDLNMVGTLIEDDIRGNLVNISSDNFAGCNFDRLNDLVTGRDICTHNRYLGKQTFCSNAKYVHLIYPHENVPKVINESKISSEVVNFASDIPPEVGLFEDGEGFSNDEKLWALTVCPIRGVQLLMSESHTDDEKQKSLFVEFMEVSAETANYDDDAKGENHRNAVPFKTLGRMYEIYLRRVKHLDQSVDIDESFLRTEGYGVFKFRSYKNAPVFNFYRERGYSDDELATKNGGGQHILGLILKPRGELMEIYSQMGKQSGEVGLQFAEFVDFLVEETDKVVG